MTHAEIIYALSVNCSVENDERIMALIATRSLEAARIYREVWDEYYASEPVMAENHTFSGLLKSRMRVPDARP